MKKVMVTRAFTYFLAILWLLPLIGLFMTSVRPYEEIATGWWHFKGATFTLRKYGEALTFGPAPIWKGILNSTLVTVPSTVLPIVVSFLAGYVLSRYKCWYGNLLLSIFLILILIPAEAIIIPLYSIFNGIGLNGTRLAVILAMSARAVPWITIFFRNYFNSIPRTFEEAAMIDGASYWMILSRVVMPLSSPAIISLSVLQFIGAWNTFIYSLIFLQPFPEKWTATQMVPFLKASLALDFSLVCAGSVLVMIVPLIIFFILHRHYARGLLGGVESR